MDEMSPEQERRLAEMKNRNTEKLQEAYMARCTHVQWKWGDHLLLYFNPISSIVSAIIIWAFVIWCMVAPLQSKEVLKEVRTWVTDVFTWLYVGTQDVWALFIIMLYFSKYSNLKLGRDDEEPEYSDGTYFTMLFSCGIGIGLFYYGVAEPIFHYKPSEKEGYNRYWGRYNDNVRAQDAINLTLFHWGIHGWIVYVIIGLLLAFLSYRRGLPMTMRTCFFPILGDKIFGIMGDAIDTLCIVCTMFGVCTSLGLGVMQLNGGIHSINNNIPENITAQLVIIWCITVLATISVISGLKVGIRRLSEICFGIGCLLLFIVFFSEKTWYILNIFVQSIGYYFQWLMQLGFHTDAFAQESMAPDKRENSTWMDTWTIFYWGWWISWSPFVGMFIAKISRGRTIKQFIMYSLTLPCVYGFMWFSVFGGAGIKMENKAVILKMNCSMYEKDIVKPELYRNKQLELFAEYGTTMLSCRDSTDMWFDVMNSYGDLQMFMSVVSLIAIILYFVTSSDSGSLVIDCLSANGHPEPPIIQRIFWALTEGATATALLVSGGKDSLTALQTVSVACGLPFTFVLNWTCVAMWRAVREEAGEIELTDGKWNASIWDLQTMRRWKTILISIPCPWYVLTAVRMKLDKKTGLTRQVCTSIFFALPFYLWIALLIASVEVRGLSYVGWAVLMFFFAFAGGVRGEVRELYGVEGNMIEDFFCYMLVYPLACMQISEQIIYGEEPPIKHSNGEIEMGNRSNGKSNGNEVV